MKLGERRSIADWLNDIIQWSEKTSRHLGGMTREEFERDEKTQDAVSKCVEAIGEAAGPLQRLDPGLQDRFPALALRQACNARNRLSHGYFAIDVGPLWTTATISVPALREAALDVAKRFGASDKD